MLRIYLRMTTDFSISRSTYFFRLLTHRIVYIDSKYTQYTYDILKSFIIYYIIQNSIENLFKRIFL